MSTTFNMFDIIFFVLSFIFILVAFFRGFVKEIFALLNWLITVALAYLLTPYAAKFIEHYSSNKLVVNVASSAIVFILIFIAIFFATRNLAHDWKEKMPENLDRFLGLLFGVVKSLLIFGLFYAVTANFYSLLNGKEEKTKKEKTEQLPEWLTQARCYHVVRASGKFMQPVISKALDNMTDKLLDADDLPKKKLDDKIDEIIDEKDDKKGADEAGALSDKAEQKVDEKYNDTGYSKKEIEKMNRLIEIVK